MSLLIVQLFFIVPLSFGQLAQAPPMGWNSYNCFGSAVYEEEVKANADYVAKNLKQYGWQYIVVDFLWSYDNPPGSRIGNPYQNNYRMALIFPGLQWINGGGWYRIHINFPLRLLVKDSNP